MCLIDIWYLANQFREVDFSFVPRGGNLAAHVVASHVACHGSSFLWDVLGLDFLFCGMFYNQVYSFDKKLKKKI